MNLFGYKIYTKNKKSQCAVCDDKWKERKPRKTCSGAIELPMISTVSLITRSRKYVSVNLCNLHNHNMPAYVFANHDTLSIKNVNDMSIHTFTEDSY